MLVNLRYALNIRKCIQVRVYIFLLQVKIWFQNRRSKYKKIMKQGTGSTPPNPAQLGGQGSVTPQPHQQGTGQSPPPSTQHTPENPTSQSHNPQGSLNSSIPNGHHQPMLPPPSSSVSPQPEMKWSEMNNMNTSVPNSYMSNMASNMASMSMAPHHYSWYSQPHHQQSLLT